MGPFLAAGEILARKNLIRNLIGVLVFLSNRSMSIRV